ncbi:uncharacterized protein LOC135169843 [Diachasmimorpha longicaudata]|uniref:uncharacterized protein LOC135169843 n=1 Tax=Diachasmimorpha longicaudata TaxID=58733 RepID=UPI0030B895BC
MEKFGSCYLVSCNISITGVTIRTQDRCSRYDPQFFSTPISPVNEKRSKWREFNVGKQGVFRTWIIVASVNTPLNVLAISLPYVICKSVNFLCFCGSCEKASLGKILSIRIIAFFMRFAGFWTAATPIGRKILKFATVFALMANLIMVYIVLIDIYYCHSHFDEIANGFLNFSISGMSSYKLAVLMPFRERFIELISYAKKNFWYRNYDRYGVNVMNVCFKKCTYMVAFISCMCSMTLVTFMVEPLIVDRQRNQTERNLPVNLHFDFMPISTTPWYEMLYIMQVGNFPSAFYCCVCFLCFDTFLCGINMTLVGQFIILQEESRNIYNGTVSSMADEDTVCLRFHKFVRKHQELIACADNVKDLYKNLVVGFVFFLSLLICMELFQAMMSVDLFIRLRSTFYVSNTIGQLYLFTLACNRLAEASFDVSYAARS